jgi:hypothetical protein
VTILGYDFPKRELPNNFEFVSMGVQGPVNEWSTDIRKYIESTEDQWLIILMEDCFIKRADTAVINSMVQQYCNEASGRFDLTNDVQKRKHLLEGDLVHAEPNTNYRVSMQPSIWNRKFLLQYLTPGLTPWQMEKQHAVNDGWEILGLVNPPLKVNEGVRKHNPHELDLNGFPEEDVNFIKTLL